MLLPKGINVIRSLKRFYTSALFITDDKANKTFSVLTPHIDFNERLKREDELERNIKSRGLKIDLYDVISVWKFYNKYKMQKNDLELAKKTIAQKLKASNDVNEIEKLKLHGKLVRDDLKALKETFYEVEENAVLKVLEIPNVLHEKTPENDEIIFHKFREYKNKKIEKSHIEIATSKNLLEIESESLYFLKNDFALHELASTFYTTDFLLNKNYIQFSNSDFVRSVVVEGCGTDYNNPGAVFTLLESDPKNFHENSRLHLVGSASLTSFMAYHTKHTIFPSLLPLKYFTVGRKYNPERKTENSSQISLFNTTQETAIELFIATKDCDDEMNLEFNKSLKDMIELYESFNYHFQVVYTPANQLKVHESLRASFQLYSPYLEKYIEVGHLSTCDNYISKRLLFNYGRGLDMNFPKIISGTVVSIPKILACIIENDYELLNDKLKKYL